MELPIYIDGERVGVLTIERENDGILALAQLRDVGRVVRLHLYGDSSFYLGIPEPEKGQLVLRRRIEGRAQNILPAHPAYAGEKPQPLPNEGRQHILWHGGRAHYF
jgi:hypothetical protein